MMIDIEAIIEGISAPITKLITKKEDQIKAKSIIQGAMIDLQKSINEQITERHKSDMMSDSWLSKNIRPGILIFLMSLWLVLVVCALFGLTIPEAYLYTIAGMTGTAFSFYFGSRGFEKVAAISKRK